MRIRNLLALLAISTVFVSPARAQLRYGPYVQNTSHNRATIVWYTTNVTTGILRYGTSPGNWQNQITVAADSAHFAEVTGLAADQRYYYEVASPTTVYASGAEYYFDTHPEIGCTKPFTFAAFGDIGTLNPQQFDVAARMKTEEAKYDFSVLLGDLVYSVGARADYKPKYFDVYKDLIRHRTWWGDLGNHDIKTANAAAYFEFFVTPANNPYNRENFYSFDYGSAHFVAIDGELHLSEPARSEQLNWIRSDLQDAINRGQRWLIAYWHEAPYSGGNHSGDGFAKTNFVPIMDQFGVDLVLCGHSHVLERTFPMVNGATINTHPNQYTKNAHAAGTIYVVSGAAGEEVTLEQPNLPMMAFQKGDMAGYSVITINQDTLSGYFITKTGVTYDPFRVIKTGLPAAPKQPVLTSIGNITTAEGDSSTHAFDAVIADASSPTTMTITGLPAFATFVDLGNGHGRLTLTPSFYQSGVYANLKLTVENSCAVSSKIFSITVNEVTDPPTLQAIGNRTMDEATTLTLALQASDPNNDALNFSVNPLPAFATLTPVASNAAQLVFAPNFRQSGVYPMTISVTDGHARASEKIILTVNDLNRAPRIDSVLATPQLVGDDTTVALQIFTHDPDEGDTLAFAWRASVGTINGVGASVTFVPPIVTDSSVVPITVAVSDGVGGAAQDTLAVRVRHVNRVPVARAGAAQFVSEGDTVRLNATASSDFEAQALSYHWRQLTGVAITLSDSQSPQPFFIAPWPEGEANLSFELLVDDGLSTSHPDTARIRINSKPRLPNGIVAARDTVGDDTTLVLSAPASDADSDSLVWQWSTSFGTINGTGANATFHPPVVTLPATALLKVAIHDGHGGMIRDSLAVLVVHTNRAPIARAGADQFVSEGDTVRLNATASSDFEPELLRFHWQQLTGVAVALSDSQSAQPFFVAPRPDTTKVFRFALTVRDSLAATATDTVAITINTLPDIIGGILASQDTIADTTTLALHANVSDAEGDSLHLTWTTTHGTLAGTGADVVFTPPLAKDTTRATIHLHVQDAHGGAREATRNLVVLHVNRAPIAIAGAKQFVTEGDSVALDATASSDFEAQTLSYHWRQVRGAPVVFSDSLAAQPRFVAPQPSGEANFAFALIVHDGLLASNPDTAQVRINSKPRILHGIVAAHDSVGDDATLALHAEVSDADNDSLTWQWNATQGAITGKSDSVVFTPAPLTHATTASFTLRVSDGKGGVANAQRSLVVYHVNRVPVARAGADQIVTEDESVTLDGSASSDFEQQLLVYHWKQLTGATVVLSDSHAVAPTFIAPHPEVETHLTFALTVNDGMALSAPDTVVITVNRRPLLHGIVAARDTIADDMTLALQAQATDADDDSLTFHWSSPAGTFMGAGMNVMFAPAFVSDTSVAKIYVRVDDGKGGSANDSTSVVLYHGNDAPVARAGVDQFVTERDTVYLSGAASSDPEHQALQYRWQQIHGEHVTLSDSQAVAPFFRAPRTTPDKVLRFVLAVSDGLAQSALDTVQITVNNLPVITNLIAAQDSVADKDSLTVNATVTEVDGEALQYFWATSAGTLKAHNASAVFLPPHTQTQLWAKIKLRVDDGHGGEAKDSIAVKVYHHNTAPAARAGNDQNVTEGDLVILDGRASHDADGDVLSYHWQQISGPAIVFMQADSAQPSFYAAGVESTSQVAIKLFVQDGQVASAPDTVVINIAPLPATAGEATFNAEADAFVRQSKPAKNYGTDGGLEVELSPPRNSYVRFKVSGIRGAIQSAKLRLRANDVAPSGGEVHVVSDTTWSETGLIYNNAPAHKPAVLAAFGALTKSAIHEVDVTAGMNGNRAVSFALISNNATAVKFISREGGTAPQLWVKFGQSSNLAPKILSGPTAAPNPVGDNTTANVSVQALDLDGDPLQYTWSTTLGTLSGSGATVTFMPSNINVNTLATISVQISDGKGGVVNAQTTLTVLPVNEAPIARAGVDQNVGYGELVTLNGASSQDAEGTPLTFDWLQVAGPSVTLSSSNVATPTFTSPNLASAVDLSFRLIVNDNVQASAPDTVTIHVADQSLTAIFLASQDGYVNEGFPSTNYNNDSTLTAALTPQRRTAYVRFNASGINGEVKSALVELRAKANSAQGGTLSLISNSSWTETGLLGKNAPALDGPMIGSQDRIQKNVAYTFEARAQVWGNGVYNFALQADSLVRYHARETTLPPRLLIQYVPLTDFAAQRPRANAGSNQTVGTEVTVMLSGSASTDPQNQSLLFYWTQITGMAVALSDLHAARPTFTAPAAAEGTTLSFQLVVSDGKYASAPDTVDVSIAVPRQTATFNAIADAYVESKSATKNLGTKSSLYAQSSPVRRGYLRFNVTGVSGQIESAILRLTSGATVAAGGAMHKITNNSWTETGITYNNAPPVDGPELSRLGSVSKNQVCDFNVLAAITGSGTYNFALVSDNTAATKYGTRESSTPPQLLITYRAGAGGVAKTEEEEEGVEAEANVPSAFELYPSYPNPFLVSMLAEPVTLKYALKEAGHVTLRIYNTLGQMVRTVVNEEKPAGLHWMRWNGRDQQGQEVGAGIYIYRLEVQTASGERYVATRKMTRVR